MKSPEVREAVDRLKMLSTIPVVLKRIFEITADPDSSPEELYEVIARDVAMAERVVEVANSSFFGHSGKVADIDQAIMLLGYENIRDIAVGMTVFSMFSGSRAPQLGNFWAHSSETAFIGSMLAGMTSMLNPGSLFLSGLMHDAGRLLFFHLEPSRYRLDADFRRPAEIESGLFGCDHAEAGSWIAEKMNLPPEQRASIRYHHDPASAVEFQDAVSVLSLAEALSSKLCPRAENDGIWEQVHDEIMIELSLGDDHISEIRSALKEEEANLKKFLKLFA